MVILRRRFVENLKEMHGIKKKKAREGRAKVLFLLIKYAKFLLFLLKSRRRSEIPLFLNMETVNIT